MSSSEAPKLDGEKMGRGVKTSRNAAAKKIIEIMGKRSGDVLRVLNEQTKRTQDLARERGEGVVEL